MLKKLIGSVGELVRISQCDLWRPRRFDVLDGEKMFIVHTRERRPALFSSLVTIIANVNVQSSAGHYYHEPCVVVATDEGDVWWAYFHMILQVL
jgi:hypothetical protein